MIESLPNAEQLLARAAAGDRTAWGALLAAEQDRLVRTVAFRMDPRLRGRIDAVDVVQEVFVEAAEHQDAYFRKPVMPLYLWLRGVASNTLLPRIPQMTPHVLARDLRQVLENKDIRAFHAKLAGEPHGDAQNDDLWVGFDTRLKLTFCGRKVTRDAGLPAYRELDEALGLTEMGEDVLTDSRSGGNKQHLLAPLLRKSIYSRLAGYEDVNDAERLCIDPAMRYVVGGRASQPEKQARYKSRFQEKLRAEGRIRSPRAGLEPPLACQGRQKTEASSPESVGEFWFGQAS